MYDAKLAAAFLDDGEPTRSIGRVGRFVCARRDLVAHNANDVVVDARRYWHVSECPGDVSDDRHSNWREEIFAERSFLRFVPCESVLMDHHEIVHELALFGCEEAVRMVLLDNVESGFVVSAGGSVVGWVRRKDRHVRNDVLESAIGA